MSDIVMPRLSDSMAEGTVVRWLKQPGESVSRGEPIVEIETDKATITYEADVDGVLAEILVGEGETVPVGAQIARIEGAAGAVGGGTPGAAPPPAPPAAAEQFAAPTAQPPPAQPPVFEPAAHGDEGGRVKASPIARRLARKLGVDLAGVTGSGPGGRVVKEDVEAAANVAAAVQSAPRAPTQAPAAQPPPETWQPPAAEPPVAGRPPAEQPAAHEIDSFDLPSGEPEPLPLPPEFQPAEPQPADQRGTAGEQPGLVAPGATVQPPPAPPPLTPPAPGTPGLTPPGMQPGAMPPLAPPAAPQPLPGPPPFVGGMTGGFPAIQPQQPGMPAAPFGAPPGGLHPPAPAGIPQPGMPATATATRGQALTTELTGSQQIVARRMAESKATAPDFFVEVDIDMTNAVNYREQLKLAVQPAPSFNDMVLKACALALRQFPLINGAYKDGHYEHYGDVNVGFVVAAGDLLAVPTLFNADQKGLAQIARESRELANAVRSRTVQPAQLSGGTFSISNLGMYGVERFTAILNPPQAAILAVGAIKRKPVIAEDGVSLAVRQIMAVTLTCDHRILYGAEGAEFLAAVKAWLESPQALPV